MKKMHFKLLLSVFIAVVLWMTIAILIIMSLLSDVAKYDTSDSVTVKISDIQVVKIEDLDIPYDTYFKEYQWSDEIKTDIENNMHNYAMVSLYYKILNKSSTDDLFKIEVIPEFDDSLNKCIKCYNKTNGTYFLNAYPGDETGMRQNIVVEWNDNLENLKNSILTQKVKLVYFRDPATDKNRANYSYSHKYKYSFSIFDTLE